MWNVFISLPWSLATYVPPFDKEISREATPACQGCSPENYEKRGDGEAQSPAFGVQRREGIETPKAGNRGRFSFNKNSCLKFRKFHLSNGMVHSGCTDPTQSTARLVIVLISRIQKKAILGTTILSNGKGHFGPTYRNDQTGQSWPPSKLVQNIPVGPNRNGPYHLVYQPKFREFWVERKAFWA